MLTEHWDEAEADFQQFYGLDLEALFHNGGARKLSALLYQLPVESRVANAVGESPGQSDSTPAAKPVREISLSELGGFLKSARGG